MLEIILSVIIGSVVGVLSFFGCMLIWGVNLKKVFLTLKGFAAEKELPANIDEYLAASNDAPLSLVIEIQKEELALAKDGKTVTGSFVSIERNIDGIQTSHRVFLN